MKNSIIKDIFLGKRGSVESVKFTNEFLRLQQESNKLSENFMLTLNQEQIKKFLDYDSKEGDLEFESNLAHYIEGFKIGFAVCKECFDD